VKSRATASFWAAFNQLPGDIQQLGVKQYQLWLDNPHHRSVRFKKVGAYWSARVTDDYRALGVMDGDTMIWFFIGSHAAYEKFLN
jgi:hypothetical protein